MVKFDLPALTNTIILTHSLFVIVKAARVFIIIIFFNIFTCFLEFPAGFHGGLWFFLAACALFFALSKRSAAPDDPFLM